MIFAFVISAIDELSKPCRVSQGRESFPLGKGARPVGDTVAYSRIRNLVVGACVFLFPVRKDKWERMQAPASRETGEIERAA